MHWRELLEEYYARIQEAGAGNDNEAAAKIAAEGLADLRFPHPLPPAAHSYLLQCQGYATQRLGKCDEAWGQFFDAVVADQEGRVQRIEVKNTIPSSTWVWGAFKMPGYVLHHLHALWKKRDRCDEYIGTLVNAFLEEGGEAFSVPAGRVYVDVGTLNGYREAMRVLSEQDGDVRVAAVPNEYHPAYLWK